MFISCYHGSYLNFNISVEKPTFLLDKLCLIGMFEVKYGHFNGKFSSIVDLVSYMYRVIQE